MCRGVRTAFFRAVRKKPKNRTRLAESRVQRLRPLGRCGHSRGRVWRFNLTTYYRQQGVVGALRYIRSKKQKAFLSGVSPTFSTPHLHQGDPSDPFRVSLVLGTRSTFSTSQTLRSTSTEHRSLSIRLDRLYTTRLTSESTSSMSRTTKW